MISALIAIVLVAQQASAPVALKARVEGRVIDSLNGEAVRKATVILRARDEEHGLSYADETDGDGHFSIDDVEPGEYAVLAERPGFGPQTTGATGAPPPSIKVEAGKPSKDLVIRLTPLGVITGRVLDEDGDPVRGAVVSALRYTYSAGKKELRNVGEVQAGETGDFRIFGLRAGTFYLKATHYRRGSVSPQPVSSYYPGTAEETHAAPVELRAGAQLHGFDIRLQSAGSYSVRFEFPEGHPPEGGYGAYLVNEQGAVVGHTPIFPQTGVDFAGIPPGSYEAVVSVSNGGKQLYAIPHVDVRNLDVDGGTLTFLPAVDVAGSVRVEGGAFNGFEKLRINLQPRYRGPLVGNLTTEVKADGSFLLKDLAPMVYEVAINRVAGVYMKSLRAGDKQLADRRVDLASKLQPLTIVLGADVGEVEGSVKNATGEPVVRARVTVIPYGDHSGRIDLSRTGFTDEKGEFKIKDVAPGEYKVFAWEDVPEGAPQDPEFRKPFEKQGVVIRMQPNGHGKVRVTAIGASAVKGEDH